MLPCALSSDQTFINKPIELSFVKMGPRNEHLLKLSPDSQVSIATDNNPGTMLRAVVTGPSQPLMVVSSPIPETPDTGYLIKTLHSGICHTDLHYIDDEVSLGNGKVWRHRDALGKKIIIFD